MSWFDRIFRRKKLRRAEIASRPFPNEWLPIVERSEPHYASLPAEHQRTLLELIQIFVAEKRFVGVAGLEMADEIKVTIAAPARLPRPPRGQGCRPGATTEVVRQFSGWTPRTRAGRFDGRAVS